MSKPQLPVPAGFPNLLKEIKSRIQQAQTRAILAANAELVRLYWDIGSLIDQRQRQQGWAPPSSRGWPANCGTNCRK